MHVFSRIETSTLSAGFRKNCKKIANSLLSLNYIGYVFYGNSWWRKLLRESCLRKQEQFELFTRNSDLCQRNLREGVVERSRLIRINSQSSYWSGRVRFRIKQSNANEPASLDNISHCFLLFLTHHFPFTRLLQDTSAFTEANYT